MTMAYLFRVPHLFVFFLICALGTFAAHLQAQNKEPATDGSSLLTAPDSRAAHQAHSERFDVLALPQAGFEIKPPVLLEKASFDDYTRELWQVQWRAGDPIDLYIVMPGGVKKPPVAIFLYSYPSDTDRFRDDKYCRAVTRYGFAAVGFVSALTGQRYHDRPWKQWFISELQESLVTSVHDVQMILNYLNTRNDLDTSRVGIVRSRLRRNDCHSCWGGRSTPEGCGCA